MATSIPGVGSGLDVNAIVNQLVAVERQPLQKLQQRATAIQSQVSSWGRLKNLIDTLRTSAGRMGTPGTWTQTQVTSSDPATVAATRANTGTATAGRYQLTVSQLAQQQVLSSSTIADGADLRGRLRIELGSYDSGSPPGFTPRSGSTAIELDFTDSATTLASVRDAINAANGGVSATILTDANGSRLVVSSTDTGRDRALRIAVSSTTVSSPTTTNTTTTGGTGTTAGDALGSLTGAVGGAVGGVTGGNGLAGADPSAGTTNTTVNPTGLSALAYDGSANSRMTQARAAQDSQFAVNGVVMNSSSNTLDGTIGGVRLQLQKTTTSPVDIVVELDGGGQRKSIDDFVAAYNAVNAQLQSDTGFDPNSRRGGLFQGDASALSVRRQLRELIGQSSTASSVMQRLSDLGMDIKRDGSIAIDSAKLNSALANPAEVAKLLSASGSGTEESKGLAVRLKGLADNLLGVDGAVDSKASFLQERLKRNQTDQERINARIELTRQRLLRLYQSLDSRVAQLNGLGNYVNQQFSAGNNGRN